MPTIDPGLADILKKYKADPKTDIWDCHGTWVVYHKVLERIAAQAGIWFNAPQIVEADGGNGVAAVAVTGHMPDDSTAWSIGEASPKNNKNAYPWAMAEKRAKDRVILKLVGLSGYVFSQEEADEFKDSTPKTTPKPEGNPDGIMKFRNESREFYREMHSCEDYDQYVAFVNTPESQAFLKRAQKEFPNDWNGDGGDIKGLKQDMTELVATLKQKEEA